MTIREKRKKREKKRKKKIITFGKIFAIDLLTPPQVTHP